MRIIISPHAGFCFGVQRAISIALEAVHQHGKVYCVGPLIHNSQAVEELRKQGLDTVDSQDQVPPSSPVLVRTHGAGPELYEVARRRRHQLIDATCPFVTRAHEAARQFREEGYQVLVLGDRRHPEAQGIVQHTGGQAIIVERPEEIEELQLSPRVAIVCQTTQRRENLQALVHAVLPQVRELRVANTICDATVQRQEASERLAREVDVMVVVGGYHSANTTRLAQICQATGTPTYHVEVAAELDPHWFEGAESVGVSAGASTPDDIIASVVQRLADIGGEGSTISWPDHDVREVSDATRDSQEE